MFICTAFCVLASTTNDAILGDGLKVAIGGGLTGLGTFIWNRYIRDRSVGIEDLLKRVEKKKPLSSYARRRLQAEADAALEALRSRLRPPHGGHKAEQWPSSDLAFWPRDVCAEFNECGCPVHPQEGAGSPLCLWVDDASDPEAIHKQFMARSESESFRVQMQLVSMKNTSREKVRLWIVAPTTLVRDVKAATKLLQQLSESVSRYIPSTQIVLELYLCAEVRFGLRGALVAPIAPNPNIYSIDLMKLSDAAKYSMARDQADESLRRGLVLGTLRPPRGYPIPRELSLGRLRPTFELLATDPLWSTIAVTGPPGTGKTELAEILASELASGSLVLIACTGKLIEVLEEFPNYQTHEDAFRSLCEAIQSAEEAQFFEGQSGTGPAIESNNEKRLQLIPEGFKSSRSQRHAFMDSLASHLARRQVGRLPVIMVDDLHAYTRLSLSISMMRKEFKHWGLRFVIVSRVRVEPVAGEIEVSHLPRDSASQAYSQARPAPRDSDFIKVLCDYWDRDQACTILREWTHERDETRIVEILARIERTRRAFVADDESEDDMRPRRYSSYFLRVSVKSGRTAAPSVVLKEEIGSILGSVRDEIHRAVADSEGRSPAELLHSVEEWLCQGLPPQEIVNNLTKARETGADLSDPILVFGLLSWTSRFNSESATLNANRIRLFAKNFVGTEQAAKALMYAGEKAGVFKVSLELATWHDPLVSDTCAVLYLDNEIKNRLSSPYGDQTIVSMVAALEKKESLDILQLALDPSSLEFIIRSVMQQANPRVDLVDKVVTDELVAGLSQTEWSNDVGRVLLENGCKLHSENKAVLGSPLARLIRHSKPFKEQCWRAIANPNPDTGLQELALAAIAVLMRNQRGYFKAVDERGPSYLRATAAYMAARTWDWKGRDTLRAQLVLMVENDQLTAMQAGQIWALWCAGQSQKQLIKLSQKLIKEAMDGTALDLSATFISACLGRVHSGTLPADRAHYSSDFATLQTEAVRLAGRGNRHRGLAAELVRWVTCYQAPELARPEAQWAIGHKGVYAIAHAPCDPLPIGQIFAKFRGLCPSFHLPTSSELRELRIIVPSQDGVRELVRDSFPQDFRFGPKEKILPANLETFDGFNLKMVDHQDLDRLKYRWRPRFLLTPQQIADG